MRFLQRMRRVWATERGSNVAQATAVAMVAAALIGALVFFAPQFGAAVETQYRCLVGAISGGGAACHSQAADEPPASMEDLGEQGCDAQCQLLGVLKGFAEGGWDALLGLFSLGKDLVLLLLGDDETWAKYQQLIEAFMRDPAGVAKALLDEMAAPIIEDWEAGRYGEATGRLLFEVLSTIGGPKALDKLGKLGKLDDLGDLGKVTKPLTCLVAAPTSKVPGLAKPALGCWTDKFAKAPAAIKRGVQALENRAAAARKSGHHQFANGLEAQLKRAQKLYNEGKLKGVEIVEGNGRYDFVLKTDEVVEFKYWSKPWTDKNLEALVAQVKKYRDSGKPVILELGKTKKNPVDQAMVQKILDRLKRDGIDDVKIETVDVE